MPLLGTEPSAAEPRLRSQCGQGRRSSLVGVDLARPAMAVDRSRRMRRGSVLLLVGLDARIRSSRCRGDVSDGRDVVPVETVADAEQEPRDQDACGAADGKGLQWDRARVRYGEQGSARYIEGV